MAVTYTTTNLIAAIKRVTHVPQGNATFNAADLLSLADMEMRTGVAPKIASCRENYWLTTQSTDVNDDNIYPLPSKALGSAIVDAKVRSGGYYIHLSRIEVSEIYSDQYSIRPAYCYYIEDFILKLLPNTLSGELVQWYYRIPSKLVETTACAQITEINGGEIICASVPSAFSASPLPELDIVSQVPGFNVLLKDTAPATIAGTTINFDDDVPSTVAVGDWVCLSGESCVVQCPLEWIEVLVQRVACKIYEIQGYDKKLKNSKAVLDQMEIATTGLVSPRTVENSKVITGGGQLLTPQTIGWKLPVRGS